MKKFIIGRKIESSQLFDAKGNVVPITTIVAGPCKILQIKTKASDGYESLQLGFQAQETRKVKKTMKGREFKVLKEFRQKGIPEELADGIKGLKEGDWFDVSIFNEGEKVNVSAIAKGKGYQGAVKRWGFHGKNATHGNRHDERTLGSVGPSYPQRVTKGRHMSGRMGGQRTTVKNLVVVKIDKDKNILAVRGAVPGRNGAIVEVRG